MMVGLFDVYLNDLKVCEVVNMVVWLWFDFVQFDQVVNGLVIVKEFGVLVGQVMVFLELFCDMFIQKCVINVLIGVLKLLDWL